MSEGKERYRRAIDKISPPVYPSEPMPSVNLRKKCLETALQYTNQDRNAAHGDPEDNFSNIAAFWNAHLQTRYPSVVWPILDATDVALMMAGMKAARLAFNPTHEDSWVDLAGYAACGMDVAMRHEGRENPIEPEAGHRDGWGRVDPKRLAGHSHDEILRQAAAWRDHIDSMEKR